MAPSPTSRNQWEAVNSGLPDASLISAVQTFWMAVTTLSGIGTIVEVLGHFVALGVGPAKELERLGSPPPHPAGCLWIRMKVAPAIGHDPRPARPSE